NSLAFLFKAEDGIRDFHVTGVQTCALPISGSPKARNLPVNWPSGRVNPNPYAATISALCSISCGGPALFLESRLQTRWSSHARPDRKSRVEGNSGVRARGRGWTSEGR